MAVILTNQVQADPGVSTLCAGRSTLLIVLGCGHVRIPAVLMKETDAAGLRQPPLPNQSVAMCLPMRELIAGPPET